VSRQMQLQSMPFVGTLLLLSDNNDIVGNIDFVSILKLMIRTIDNLYSELSASNE
jgi:hypothetical protein